MAARRVTGPSSSVDPRLSLAEVLTWATIVTTAYLLVELRWTGLGLLAGVSMVLGLRTFLGSGGRMFDAISIWGLANLLFVGVAALLIPAERVLEDYDTLLRAMYVAQLMQLGTIGIASVPVSGRPAGHQRSPFTLSAASLLIVGSLGFAVGMALPDVSAMNAYANGFTWTGPLVAMLGAASATRRRQWLLFIPVALFAWYLAVWSGSGRLVIFSLAMGMLMVLQYRLPPRTGIVKVLLPVLLVPALFIASLIEVNRSNPDASLVEVPEGFVATNSLYSVWAPLHLLGSLLRMDQEGALVRHGFDTYVASLLVWVPRDLWPGKPVGWGRELAFVFNPRAAENSIHTEAALAPAELLWGFGLLGILFGIVVYGLLLRALNEKLRSMSTLNQVSGRGAPGLIVWVIMGSALLSLWWGGSFNFLSRVLMQLLALAIMTAVGWVWDLPARGTANGGAVPHPPSKQVMRTTSGLVSRAPLVAA